MKKYFVLLFQIVAMSCFADGLNREQLQLKSDIFKFLKEENYSPVDQEENVISFEKDKTTYYVYISETDVAPMYVTMSVTYSYSKSDYEYPGVMFSTMEMNSYKGVKFYCTDESIRFQAELFLHDSEPFRYAFFRLMSQMELMNKHFAESYKKASDFLNGTNDSSSVDIDLNSGTVKKTISFPKVNYRSSESLYLTKCTLMSNCTILDFRTYNNNGNSYFQWCNIDKDAYIITGGKKFKMLKTEGIAIAPQQTNFPSSNSSVEFKLYFEPIPENTTTFDFIESADGWQVKGAQIGNKTDDKKKEGKHAVNSKVIETQYHSWSVVSVELLADCTIVHKKVTPKTEGTYMFSDTSEYIEDADTGKKYYLTSSSLGISPKQTTSYNKKPIEFTETYPALPASVKKINISSGTQYYVKDFKCR